MNNLSNSFYYEEYQKLPALTFKGDSYIKDLVCILYNLDIQSFPTFLKDYFKVNQDLLIQDLKQFSFLMLYPPSDKDLTFNRIFVYYEETIAPQQSQPPSQQQQQQQGKPEQKQYGSIKYKKLQDLGSKIGRKLTIEYHIEEVSLYFQDEITQKTIGLILNAICLTNYKFDCKTYHDQQKGLDLEANQGKRPFKPIRLLNILNPLIEKLDDYAWYLYKSSGYSLLARQMQNERANIATTSFVVEIAHEIANVCPNIQCKTIIGEELLVNGLNLIHAVGKGSLYPPALVSLFYQGNPLSNQDTIAIIGKGICFDSGGLNIKPTGSMETMYADKSGGSVVLAVIKACAELNLKVNVVGTVALAENSVGAMSYRPSDIIKSHKGLTVEIGNTDAEGRLVLADAMSWTQQTYKPRIMLELSTLTGASVYALGPRTGALFTNNDILATNLLRLSEIVSEPLYQLPINDEHRENMKSTFADLSNSGVSKYGGASKAAAFLEYFVEKDVAWAHLDISGPTILPDNGVYTGGTTGFGLKIILGYIVEKALGYNNVIEKEY